MGWQWTDTVVLISLSRNLDFVESEYILGLEPRTKLLKVDPDSSGILIHDTSFD